MIRRVREVAADVLDDVSSRLHDLADRHVRPVYRCTYRDCDAEWYREHGEGDGTLCPDCTAKTCDRCGAPCGGRDTDRGAVARWDHSAQRERWTCRVCEPRDGAVE